MPFSGRARQDLRRNGPASHCTTFALTRLGPPSNNGVVGFDPEANVLSNSMASLPERQSG